MYEINELTLSYFNNEYSLWKIVCLLTNFIVNITRRLYGDVLYSNETQLVLSPRYDFIQVNAFSLMPNENSRCFSIIGRSITLYAADKSCIINVAIDPSTRASAMSLCTFKRAVSVE